MSEIVTDTAVVESAPSSTADVASQVIDAFDATESNGVDVSGETPTETTPAAEAPTPAPAEAAAPLTEAEKLLHEAGYKSAKKPDGRDNYIPHSKVVKIIENGLKQGKGEFGQRYQALETEATQLRTHIADLQRGLAGDPKAFLAELATIDARYQAFLEQPAAQPAQAPAVDAQMPEPDFALPDGSRTYSLDGIQKQLIPWLTQAITKQVEGKVDERLKPITEREQQAQAKQKEAEFTTQVQTRTRETMQKAQAWPMFGQLPADGTLTPFQAEVLGELAKDTDASKAAGRRPSMTLREAYLEVYSRHQAPEKVRERVLAELKQAPRSTATGRAGAESPRVPGPATTSDIATRTLDRLERGA